MTDLQDILSRINPPQEHQSKKKILIYGPSGVGKTSLYDGIKDALILDVEEGTSVLRKKKEMQEYGTRIFPLKSWEDLNGVFKLLESGQMTFTNIVLDSITDMVELCKDHVLETQQRRRVSDETPSQQDYGVISERMRKMLRSFRSLDANIVYIARERHLKDEETGAERVRPDVSGKLQDDLPGAMDVTVYMRANNEGARFAGFNLTGKYLAKDRTHQFPDYIENPTWADFEKALPELVPAQYRGEDAEDTVSLEALEAAAT